MLKKAGASKRKAKGSDVLVKNRNAPKSDIALYGFFVPSFCAYADRFHEDV